MVDTQRQWLIVQALLFENLAYVSEYGDHDLLDHLTRVSKLTGFLTKEYLHASPIDTMRSTVAALTHDIGKGSIPKEILLKTSALSAAEKAFVESHAETGYLILNEIEKSYLDQIPWMVDKKMFRTAKNIARYHHENWDGSGYPHHLKKFEIPQAARIVKISDVIDALLSKRSYKSAWEWAMVKEEVQKLSGIEFDPKIVRWINEHDFKLTQILAVGGRQEVN